MSFELGSFPLGDIITGQIVKLESRGVLVDFGTEQLAYVSQSELSLAEIQTPEDALQLKEIREFLVIGNYDGEHDFFFSDCTLDTIADSDRLYEAAQYRAGLQCEHSVNREDLIIHTKILGAHQNGVSVKIQWFLCSEHPPTITFSIRRLEMQKAWERVRQMQAEDVTLYPSVLKKTHSAMVKVEGLRGFICNVDRCREKLAVGEEIPLSILEAREEFDRLTLIQRSTLIKLRQLQVGQVVSSIVQGIKPYGVFIEIEGLYAFLPTSKIIPTVNHPEQIFKVNDFVTVTIAEIDLEKARINLESGKKLA